MTVKIKRPPLSAMMTQPLHEIKRLGLTVEGTDSAGLDDMKPYADVFATAHAPNTKGRLRLNPAATEDDFREESIKIIELTKRLPKKIEKVLKKKISLNQCITFNFFTNDESIAPRTPGNKSTS